MTYGISAIERDEGAVQVDKVILNGRLFERSQKPPFQGGYTGSNPVPTIWVKYPLIRLT